MEQDDYYFYFGVNGAGKIRISKTDKHSCGGEKGFGIGCSWGAHGFAGGIIPKEVAVELANHILNTVNQK